MQDFVFLFIFVLGKKYNLIKVCLSEFLSLRRQRVGTQAPGSSDLMRQHWLATLPEPHIKAPPPRGVLSACGQQWLLVGSFSIFTQRVETVSSSSPRFHSSISVGSVFCFLVQMLHICPCHFLSVFPETSSKMVNLNSSPILESLKEFSKECYQINLTVWHL